MKKLLLTLCASLAVVSATVALAPSADAASGCVTRSEYAKVGVGTSRAAVARVFGTSGTRVAISKSGGYTNEVRAYRTCSKHSAVAISYGKNPGNVLRIQGKSAVWR